MREYREGARIANLAIFAGALVLVVGLVVGAMWLFGFGWFSNATADFRGEVDKKNRVEGSGAYRIAAYDHFFDLCAAVQTDEATLLQIEKELEDANPDLLRRNQIAITRGAIARARAEKINTYNADAAKGYTRGQFRDSGLPDRLDINAKETQCTV
jgi:hypothetical protein